MKNIVAFAVATSIVTLSSPIALADPRPVNIEIQCPNSQNQSNVLSNYGDFIAGYGLEIIQGQDNTQIYFKSTSSTKGVPAQLDNYNNAGVKYTSTTGVISCAYDSMIGDPAFEVNYTLTNGKGGKAAIMGNDRINIVVPFGFKA